MTMHRMGWDATIGQIANHAGCRPNEIRGLLNDGMARGDIMGLGHPGEPKRHALTDQGKATAKTAAAAALEARNGKDAR
jgi:hypothetical protein